jgi:hypothetical protein
MENPYGLGEGLPRELDSSNSPATGTVSQVGKASTIALVTPEARPEHPMPVWMQRTYLIIYVMFCLEVGLMLTLVPWTQAWNHNTYIFSSAWLRSLLQSGFVRGVVTGIGLVDIWLGIWEAVQYRDVRPLPSPAK